MIQMVDPFDGWTFVHGFSGFLLGRIKLNRSLFYPLPILWEVYQLFFHYQPQGYYLEHVWLNSLTDILSCIICYEAAVRYPSLYDKNLVWPGISNGVKTVATYIFITFAIAWLFWDDVLRLGLSAEIPLPQIPLLLGAVSPILASFIVREYVSKEVLCSGNRIAYIMNSQWPYYIITGLLPSATAFLFVSFVTN